MKRLLADFRQESNERAQQPEFFWATQRSRINANLRDRRTPRGLGWAATVAAVVALVVVMVTPVTHHTVRPTSPTAKNAPHAVVDDEALLESIDQTTSSSVPDALAPANILASEMDRGLEGASKK